MNELKIGATLQNGKYRIEHVLGQGGFGITYLATQTTLGCKVAIKEFFFQDCCERHADDSRVSVITASKQELVDKFRRKFLKEARLLLAINHHNIVRVMDAFEENDTAYYAMEYIEGISLSQLISQKGRLTAAETLTITDSVGQALVYLHARNINHLDIKPANIMIENGTERVLLIDFGVSKQYDPETGQSTTTTPVGVSHGYAPLEQYNNGGIQTFSPQSDVYALGATMLKMLTGITPRNAVELSQQGGPTIAADIPVNFAAAIRAAMQPVKANRPQSVQQLLTILHDGPTDEEATVVGAIGNANGTSGAANGASNATNNGAAGAANGASGNGSNASRSANSKAKQMFIGIALALVFVGSIFYLGTDRNKTDTTDNIMAADSDTVAVDSVAIEEDTNVYTESFSQSIKGKMDKTSLSIEYPTSGPELLVQNIREWINESLGGKYNGDLSDGKALFNFYFGTLSREMTENSEYENYNQVTIKKLYENDKIATFVCESYFYGEGAAHGMSSTRGVTFRKSDGRKFTVSLLDGSYKYQSEIKAGLKKYFELSSDEELMGRLMLNKDAGSEIPFPQNDPWITAAGVVFCYSEYEIACYADGMPTFTIPESVIKKKSAATTQTFFE